MYQPSFSKNMVAWFSSNYLLSGSSLVNKKYRKRGFPASHDKITRQVFITKHLKWSKQCINELNKCKYEREDHQNKWYNMQVSILMCNFRLQDVQTTQPTQNYTQTLWGVYFRDCSYRIAYFYSKIPIQNKTL